MVPFTVPGSNPPPTVAGKISRGARMISAQTEDSSSEKKSFSGLAAGNLVRNRAARCGDKLAKS
jgi:hypothetical protein